ncbi:MAG: hypothetical protein V3U96_03480 [Paracoccaceae bacterium]
MKFTSSALICTALAVSGCGSSSGGGPRYAQPGDVLANGDSFPVQDVKRYVEVDGTQSLKDQTIGFSISDDGNTVYIAQNHKNYVLTWNSVANRYEQVGASFFFDSSSANVVQLAFFQDFVGTGYQNVGSFVFGYETDPTQINPATAGGNATFTGEASIGVFINEQNGYGGGPVTLNAVFGTQTITGTMNVSHDPAGGGNLTSFPDSIITINPAGTPNISGNKFNTDLSIAFTPVPGPTVTIAETGLTGGFYGVNAVAVGATFWAEGDVDGDTLLIQGGLTAE